MLTDKKQMLEPYFPGDPDEDENGAYDDIDINHDESNNEHEHD